MKKKWFLAAALCGLLTAAQAADDLRQGFRNPPPEAQARTWWHWLNGNATRAGITADLEAMHQVGIREAQLFNADQGYPEGDAPYLSERWMELFRFALDEAARLGMEIGFHNSAGWSLSGGSWVTPAHGMQTVAYAAVTCKGGKEVRLSLPQPATRLDYYRDIAVLAFPVPAGERRIGRLDVKTLSGSAFDSQLLPDTTVIDAASCIRLEDIVDLSSRLAPDGTLVWNAPAGEWTVMRFGHTPTGATNHPANGYGHGLECDKMNRAAVDAFWQGGIEPVLRAAGAHVGTTLTGCLIDSYEAGSGNWTPGFEREFLRRNGYSCLRYLPALAGYYVESGEQSERFLWDFRRTIGQLMAENYYGYFAEKCRAAGLRLSVEPYGGPFDWLGAAMCADVPMSEFWVNGTSAMDYTKLAASAAHLRGTPYVGAESFTADGANSRWLNHPAVMERAGDRAWAEGVNRFLFHTYVHQPWNAAPGLTFGPYGVEMSRLNTWWKQAPAYMDYVTRSQYLLQQGRFAADVLVYVGESSPNKGIYRSDLKQRGYDYDEVGTGFLDSLTVDADGALRTPAGSRYRLLLLPDIRWATPSLLERLRRLAAAGAFIIGPRPVRSPSLAGYPQCDREVERLAAALWSAGTGADALIRDIPVEEALEKLRLRPDFDDGGALPRLLFLHRTTPEAEIYFVANPQRQYRTITCRFRVTGRQPERWDAETGRIEPVAEWKEESGCTAIPLRFRPEESCFLVFRKPDKTPDPVTARAEQVERHVAPLRGLEIVKAEYGYFLPDGVVDVTAALASRMEHGQLPLVAGNGLAGDPAPGVVKELRVKYCVGGEVRRATATELGGRTLDPAEEGGEIRLLQALYGQFPAGFDDNLPGAPRNVTNEVRQLVARGELCIQVGETIGKREPLRESQLHLVYRADGELFDEKYPAGYIVDLARHEADTRLAVGKRGLVWITPFAGNVRCTTASGAVWKGSAGAMPAVIDLSADGWDVTFCQRAEEASRTYRFDSLCSWTERAEDDVKYYSGTAVYRKRFHLPKEYLRKNRSLCLDLGRVCVMAEVVVNGRSLGVLWKAPFRMDITEALRAGENDMEIRVTNLWPNRLIGDARYPEDMEWGDWLPKSWPGWLTDGEERNSQRTTFATWRHWSASDPLQPSGLMGPVVLRPYVHVPLSRE